MGVGLGDGFGGEYPVHINGVALDMENVGPFVVVRYHLFRMRMNGTDHLGMGFGKTVGINRQRQHFVPHGIEIAVGAFTRELFEEEVGQIVDVGFGRRKMEVKADELKAMIIYQVGALKAFAEAEGLKLQHVKPHGAMYNMAARDINMAIPICEGIAEVDKELIILGLSGSCFAEAAERTGLMFVSEVFADRAYEDDGSLRARSLPGAVITDEAEAIKRVIKMIKEHSVTAYSGKEVHVEPGSVCLHGDNEKALLFAKKIREALTSEGIEVKAMR